MTINNIENIRRMCRNLELKILKFFLPVPSYSMHFLRLLISKKSNQFSADSRVISDLLISVSKFVNAFALVVKTSFFKF